MQDQWWDFWCKLLYTFVMDFLIPELVIVMCACSCGSTLLFDKQTRLITLDSTVPPAEKKAPKV
jgi:hypothetical protein